jgi:hypothetical protein
MTKGKHHVSRSWEIQLLLFSGHGGGWPLDKAIE